MGEPCKTKFERSIRLYAQILQLEVGEDGESL